MWAALLNTILGIWIMVSPDLLEFQKNAADNNYIVGPLIVTFSIIAIWEVNRSVRYFNVFAGLWLAVSPFILAFDSTAAIANNLICGILIAALSLIKGKIKRRYGGGWQSLIQTGDSEL